MTVTEKAAYLKGLASGLSLDETKPETKLINEMIEVIDSLALSVNDLEDELSLVTEQLDAVDEDLDALEEYVYDECDCDLDSFHEDDLYEVECPSCHELVEFDEASIMDGSAECPACGEHLEFDFDCCDCDECADED